MKKEQLEYLDKTLFIETVHTMNIVGGIVNVNLMSEYLIQKNDVNQALKKISYIIRELTELSENKQNLIADIVIEEQKNDEIKKKTSESKFKSR